MYHFQRCQRYRSVWSEILNICELLIYIQTVCYNHLVVDRPELIIHKIPPIILFEYSRYLSPLFFPHYSIIHCLMHWLGVTDFGPLVPWPPYDSLFPLGRRLWLILCLRASSDDFGQWTRTNRETVALRSPECTPDLEAEGNEWSLEEWELEASNCSAIMWRVLKQHVHDMPDSPPEPNQEYSRPSLIRTALYPQIWRIVRISEFVRTGEIGAVVLKVNHALYLICYGAMHHLYLRATSLFSSSSLFSMDSLMRSFTSRLQLPWTVDLFMPQLSYMCYVPFLLWNFVATCSYNAYKWFSMRLKLKNNEN